MGVTYWWMWLVWAVVVACQIGVGLGLRRTLAPKPLPPVRHQRPDYQQRLDLFEGDRQHQRTVEKWRAQQDEQ